MESQFQLTVPKRDEQQLNLRDPEINEQLQNVEIGQEKSNQTTEETKINPYQLAYKLLEKNTRLIKAEQQLKELEKIIQEKNKNLEETEQQLTVLENSLRKKKMELVEIEKQFALVENYLQQRDASLTKREEHIVKREEELEIKRKYLLEQLVVTDKQKVVKENENTTHKQVISKPQLTAFACIDDSVPLVNTSRTNTMTQGVDRSTACVQNMKTAVQTESSSLNAALPTTQTDNLGNNKNTEKIKIVTQQECAGGLIFPNGTEEEKLKSIWSVSLTDLHNLTHQATSESNKQIDTHVTFDEPTIIHQPKINAKATVDKTNTKLVSTSNSNILPYFGPALISNHSIHRNDANNLGCRNAKKRNEHTEVQTVSFSDHSVINAIDCLRSNSRDTCRTTEPACPNALLVSDTNFPHPKQIEPLPGTECKKSIRLNDEKKKMLLHWAETGYLRGIKSLTKEGYEINTAKDKKGKCALHLAAYKGHLEIIKYLVQNAGADVGMTTYGGWTALHFATSNGHLHVVKYLVETAKADIEAVTNGGYTVLHSACTQGHIKVIEYLVHKAGANVKAKDICGRVPFELTKSDHIKSLLAGYYKL